MPSTICKKGKLTNEGVECQAFRVDADELFTLTGDLGAFQNGDEVLVCGTIVANSLCQQGTTIDVIWITDDVDEALEGSLKQEIKNRWPDKFIEAKWKKRPQKRFPRFRANGRVTAEFLKAPRASAQSARCVLEREPQLTTRATPTHFDGEPKDLLVPAVPRLKHLSRCRLPTTPLPNVRRRRSRPVGRQIE